MYIYTYVHCPWDFDLVVDVLRRAIIGSGVDCVSRQGVDHDVDLVLSVVLVTVFLSRRSAPVGALYRVSW